MHCDDFVGANNNSFIHAPEMQGRCDGVSVFVGVDVFDAVCELDGVLVPELDGVVVREEEGVFVRELDGVPVREFEGVFV